MRRVWLPTSNYKAACSEIRQAKGKEKENEEAFSVRYYLYRRLVVRARRMAHSESFLSLLHSVDNLLRTILAYKKLEFCGDRLLPLYDSNIDGVCNNYLGSCIM